MKEGTMKGDWEPTRRAVWESDCGSGLERCASFCRSVSMTASSHRGTAYINRFFEPRRQARGSRRSGSILSSGRSCCCPLLVAQCCAQALATCADRHAWYYVQIGKTYYFQLQLFNKNFKK